MQEVTIQELALGEFAGRLDSRFIGDLDETRLLDLSARIDGAVEGVLGTGRHRVVALPFVSEGKEVVLAVKAFGKQSALKDRLDAKVGSKASRTFAAARFLEEKLIGTPQAIGYIERWDESRLKESYFLSVLQDPISSFKDELIHLYRHDPDCAKIMALLEHVACGVRAMHDAGFYHRDLGNQNILMMRERPEAWSPVQFIDLNRGRIRDEVTMKERAFDISRISLPSDFLRIFIEMYWRRVPPSDFMSAQRRYRKRFAWHTATRKWRHPIRSLKSRTAETEGGDDYPGMRDIWVWDEKSAQAIVVMQHDERQGYYPRGRNVGIAKSTLKAMTDVRREYKALLADAFAEPVILSERIGVALEVSGMDVDKQLGLLERLGRIPVMIRFYHHEAESQWAATAAVVKRLHADEHRVAIALVQDRRAVQEPEAWRHFLETVMGQVADYVETVEFCHAVNRVKWGVWSPAEHQRLLEPVVDLQLRYQDVRFTGPSCIDFEYQYVVAALDQMPKALEYGALSHHLYVDRRGAPENTQGRYSLVEKCALLRAIARWSRRCEDRVIISEVNWPIQDTGEWSPVGSPYVSPGVRTGDPSVSEELYASYMLRYILLALCSGFVDQVYWWRLVAHGFGLVDERGEDGWRERPAFLMLENFLKTLGTATFIRKLESVEDTYALLFEKDDESIVVAWSNQGEVMGPWSFEYLSARDAYGENRYSFGELVPVDHAPVYFKVAEVV